MMRYVGCALACVALVLACTGTTTHTESGYPSASCNACEGQSYTQADCETWGRDAHCESTTFETQVPGCTNGCKFTNCSFAPSGGGPKDAGSTFDAASDPTCAAANANALGKGLFSSKPSCATPHEGNINGTTIYTCPCGSPCPCGYECGSIPLSVGGTIGSVCAPPQ